MTIPSSSTFPEAMDSDDNLFLVHDSLRVRLAEDYNPGDKFVEVEGDPDTMLRFPPTGIITLTEQCSDIDMRALSFYYSSKTENSFLGLEMLPEFLSMDSQKPKKSTNVTMNVLDLHHNHLKDALISVQEFLGTKYQPDDGTITQRINFLKEVALSPKAWFSSNRSFGLVPFTVSFRNESLRMGEGYSKQTWDFGDGSPPLVVESSGLDEYLAETVQEKAYVVPDNYTVKLTVENEYGSDTVEFEQMIVAKTESPEEASIAINHRFSQNYTPGDIVGGARPKIRSSTNTFLDLEVPDGEDPDRPGYSYAGEQLKPPGPPIDQRKIDPIREYTWRLGDDLPHPNSRFARASYDLGGYYDITLRVDTGFGSYRITTYEKSIDIVEDSNLWLFNYGSSGDTIKAYEFGLKSETFKVLGNSEPSIERNNGFLGENPLNYDDTSKYYSFTLERARREFEQNVEFANSGSLSSGNKGNSLIFWAKGGASLDSKEIGVKKYNAFDDAYENLSSISNRPWNWASMSSPDRTYFIFGQSSPIVSGRNDALAERVEYDISTQSAASPVPLLTSDFENGADELLSHPSYYENDEDDPDFLISTNGYFASYRTAWKDQTGYILRNSSVNEFFRFGDFYRTKGTLSSPFGSLTKMPDMPGSIKTEGQLLPLSNGIFFFNNSGEVCAWNDTSLVWEVGRSGSTALTFRSVQDTSAQNFDDRSNTLKAASDGDRAAYLSYDYGAGAFVKFNGTDLTFTLLRRRPEGKQFKMGVY